MTDEKLKFVKDLDAERQKNIRLNSKGYPRFLWFTFPFAVVGFPGAFIMAWVVGAEMLESGQYFGLILSLGENAPLVPEIQISRRHAASMSPVVVTPWSQTTAIELV